MKKIICLSFIFVMLINFSAFAQDELPDWAKFKDVFDISSIDEVQRGVFVYETGRSAEMTLEDTKSLLELLWYFDMDRTVWPHVIASGESSEEFYVNIYTTDKKLTLLYSYEILFGAFGEENYIWYGSYTGHGRNALYHRSMELYDDYLPFAAAAGETPAVPIMDYLKLPQHEWAIAEIQEAAKNNLLPYDLAKDYETPITRENFCKLIERMLTEIQAKKEGDTYRSHTVAEYGDVLSRFTKEKLGVSDLEGVPYTSFTDYENPSFRLFSLVTLGLMDGKEDGTFDPYGNLTREEAAKILGRTANLFLEIAPSGLPFADSAEIADWAKDYVSWASDNKIMYGIGDGKFDPTGTYTTEQAIATTLRLFNLIKQ